MIILVYRAYPLSKHVLLGQHCWRRAASSTTTVFDTPNRFKKQFNYSYVPGVLKQIETKWKDKVDLHWNTLVASENHSNQKSKYILSMFPYPSGQLHLGHIRIYTTSDILFKTSVMCGENAINPMGFDSFGLPAENAAKLHNQSPFLWTESNVEQMTAQLSNVGYHFHWREKTSDPAYYQWTQWLFVKLFRSGLAYQGVSQVNWDPIDGTVLADEQVDAEGRSWRSGAPVEKRFYKQWLVKTNAFANDLFLGEDIIDTGHWNFILAHQRWWIKKPNGYLFYLKLTDTKPQLGNVFQIFTQYPELFSSKKTFIGISKSHWLADGKDINQVVAQVRSPFHQDHMIDVRIVDNLVNPVPSSTQATLFSYREAFKDETKREEILEQARSIGVGGYFTSDTYRDWLISRQRFWGTPIPIVHCSQCGPVPVNEEQLPVTLPHIDYSQISGFVSQDISSPLKNFAPREWLHTRCPQCNSPDAIRETDTCDTFFDSSWYFLRYFSAPSENQPFDMSSLTPVYCYIGGKEHAALHLFYARFITHFLHSEGYLTFREPFRTLLMQAIVKARTFKLNGRYITAEEAKGNPDVEVNFEKMSKSKGTGVNPDLLVEQYGADAVRWTIISVGNPESERLWDSEEKEFGPTLVFFHRILLTIEECIAAKNGLLKIKALDEESHRSAVANLSNIIDQLVFNVRYSLNSSYQIRNGTSSIHKLINALRSNIRSNVVLSTQFERGLASLLIMLSPFVPCFASECWQALATQLGTSQCAQLYGFDYSKPLLKQNWPCITNPDYEYIVRFTFRNQNGREEECKRIKVPLKKLGSWQESEIRHLLKLREDEVDWIEIVKHCSVVVRVKHPSVANEACQRTQ